LPGSIEDAPIVALADPFGMIDLVHNGGPTHGISCRISEPGGINPKIPRNGKGHWEADLRHGKAYQVDLTKRSLVTRQITQVATKQFDVSRPHRVVEVP